MTHTRKRISWDDLQYVLAVADCGGLAPAARALGVSHTTVLRRIHAFEGAHGLRLFDRLTKGYELTLEGEAMLMTARHIFSDLADLEQRLADRYVPLEGTLRVATTDTLAASVLPRHLAAFRIQHPGIVLELAIGNPVSNFTQRDADVAVWPMMALPEVLVGQRMCGIAYATYAVSGRETGPWLVPDEALAGSVVGRWARIHLPTEQIAARADSLLALRDLATAGMGRVVLPCYLGDATLHLNRVSPVLLEVTSELWLLTHKDLRRNAAVAKFTRFMKCSLADDQDRLEGQCPT